MRENLIFRLKVVQAKIDKLERERAGSLLFGDNNTRAISGKILVLKEEKTGIQELIHLIDSQAASM